MKMVTTVLVAHRAPVGSWISIQPLCGYHCLLALQSSEIPVALSPVTKCRYSERQGTDLVMQRPEPTLGNIYGAFQHIKASSRFTGEEIHSVTKTSYCQFTTQN